MTNTSTSDDAGDTVATKKDALDGKDGSEGGESKPFEKSEQAWKELIESRQDVKAKNQRLEAQLNTLTEQFNASKSELETFKAQMTALAREKRDAEEEVHAKGGNIEALRESHRTAIGEKEAEIADLNKKLADAVAKYADYERDNKRAALKEAALLMLGKVAVDAEDALSPHLFDLEAEFELVEDKGKRTLRVKDSVDEPAVYAEKKLKKLGKHHLLLNDRESGSGAQPNKGDAGTSSKTLTKEEIMAMPDKGAKYFRENPAAAQAFLGKKP